MIPNACNAGVYGLMACGRWVVMFLLENHYISLFKKTLFHTFSSECEIYVQLAKFVYVLRRCEKGRHRL